MGLGVQHQSRTRMRYSGVLLLLLTLAFIGASKVTKDAKSEKVKPGANKEKSMKEATTVIICENWPYCAPKTLSSGIPVVEAKKNLNEDLAEGTNAPIGDDSSIPLKMSENTKDFKITTELIKEATGDLSEDLTEKTVNAVTTAPNKSKVSPGTEGKQNPKSRSICGRPPNFHSKIVGGDNATIEEFPWLALLAVTKKASNGKMEFRDANPPYQCGGSLIADEWVLTAGHCIVLKDTATLVEGVRAKFGATSRPQKTGYVEIDSQRIILYEKYEAESEVLKRSVNFDIGLIKLKRGMTAFRKEVANVNTVCLPFDYVDKKSWAGKSLVVAGWGYVKQDAMKIEAPVIAEDLQKLEVNRVSNQKCRAAFGDSEQIGITENSQNFCAGGEEGKDSCAGDSGGPLMLTQERMGRKNHTLVGLVSWGREFCGQKNQPGVYADVSFFLEWILNTIA